MTLLKQETYNTDTFGWLTEENKKIQLEKVYNAYDFDVGIDCWTCASTL